jgi:hypothetical protein
MINLLFSFPSLPFTRIVHWILLKKKKKEKKLMTCPATILITAFDAS